MPTESSSSRIEKKAAEGSKVVLLPTDKRCIVPLFVTITFAAFMSHIAYDVFVDTGASFPLLAPFIFSDFLIPQIYALPIEGVAVLLVYYCSLHYQKEPLETKSDLDIKIKALKHLN